MSPAELNQRHAIDGHLHFTREGDGPTLAEIDNAHGHATLALEGGQLLSWTPKGDQPVVWLSPEAVYKPGKSLRGGVPVCWPWFGPHESDATLPGHGFARNKPWSVTASEALADGATRLTLTLDQDDETAKLWPHRCALKLTVTVGTTLTLALTTRNLGDQPVTLTEALHTYFHVGDIERIEISGLEGVGYVDKVNDGAHTEQQGAVVIRGETDRVYLAAPDECVIHDPDLGRRIHVTKHNGRSTVVWNPWAEKGAAFGDMGEDGYRRMLCVESANALSDAWSIPPGDEHTLSAEYQVSKM
ncbi:D-hexose-6-phosphate mutarotase [Endothiovibrio diazotrophicus]